MNMSDYGLMSTPHTNASV